MPTLKDFKVVQGEAALAWVRQQNKITQDTFDSAKEFDETRTKCFNALASQEKIPTPSFSETNRFFNFWCDDQNPKGLLRKIDPADYYAHKDCWDVLLDIDALSKSEGINWVYSGIVDRVFDEKQYAIILLSNGGSDAVVGREFDIEKKCFVENGFYIPEAKSCVEWIDPDTLLLATDVGEGSLTKSGYPASVRSLRRGQSLKEAETLFEIDRRHVEASFTLYETSKRECWVFKDTVDFYKTIYHVWFDDTLSQPHRLPLPMDADIEDIFRDTALITLHSDWQFDDNTCFPADSLLLLNLEKFRQNPKCKPHQLEVNLLFMPGDRCAIEDVKSNADSIFVLLLNNVSNELFEFIPTTTGFAKHKISLPDYGDIGIVTLSDDSSEVLLTHETLIESRTLYSYNTKTKLLVKLCQNPILFDASQYQTQQFEAISKDGTKIPYYVVSKKNMKYDGANPTVLYGYGGFQDSLNPNYVGVNGIGLLEKGIVYAQANIRGGGEFGAKWHKDGSVENKQNSFDDFIAVAEDLIKRRITSRQFLAIEGGSNGGLLVGACITQRPELFAAALCEVPLLDMLIYHKLLAGDSWIGEYGDPKNLKMREIIKKYSPLHNIDPAKTYPPIMITTSTKDDRVHPYHARAMTYTLQKYGNTVHYFEDIDGGHSCGADLKKIAENCARNYQYYYEKILKPALTYKNSLVAANNSVVFFPGIENRKKRSRAEEENVSAVNFGT